MSISKKTFSSLETTNESELFILNTAMIKSSGSSESSEYSDVLINNNISDNCILNNEAINKNESSLLSSFSNDNFKRQSIILAGSHKQNLSSLLSDDSKDNNVEHLTNEKSHSPVANDKYKNKAIPQLIVTQPTPQKMSNTMHLATARNIVSPVAQYMKGKGVVQGRKIVFKNV